jgi:CRP-like cAMP-binding protein
MDGRIRFVTPFETALYLKRVAPLRDLAPEYLAVVAQQAQERFFRRGDVLFSPGMLVGSFHIVVDGRIRVRGAEHGDTTLGPDETLGLLSLLARWPEGAEAIAETDTRTLEIDADALDEVFEDHFAILQNELRTLSCRMLRERMDTPSGQLFLPEKETTPVPDRELDFMDRLQFMLASPIFTRANIDVLITMTNRTPEVRFDAGATLWRAGDPSGFLYAIVAGRVRCQLPDGRWFVCGQRYPLGNLESQCGVPRWYDAVAETRVVALHSQTDLFLDLLEDHFEMARGMLSAMATGLITVLVEKRQTAAVAAVRP